MTFTLTFTLFLPTSFKDMTVLKEKLDGNDHATCGGGRPLAGEKGGLSCGRRRHRCAGEGSARLPSEPVRGTAVAARRGTAGWRTRVRVRDGASGPGLGESSFWK